MIIPILNPLNSASNLLINGGFTFFQRQTAGTATAFASGAYCADRWYLLTQANNVSSQQVVGSGAYRYYGKFLQANASAQRFAIVQVLPTEDSIPLRGQSVTFNVQLPALPSGSNMRMAICEWTGTADAPVKAVINSWTSTTYTAGNFFSGTTTTVDAVSPSITSAGTATLTATVSDSCNNLYAIIWTESACAQNAYFTITAADLYLCSAAGAVTRAWAPRPYAQELAMCGLYYEKSNSLPFAPGSTEGAYYWSEMNNATRSVGQTYYFTLPAIFKVLKRANPVCRFWNVTTGVINSFYDASLGHNITGTTMTIYTSTCGVTTWNLTNINIAVPAMDIICYIFDADAEIGV